MNKGMRIGLTTAETAQVVTAVVLLVLAGPAFNANAQTVTVLYTFGNTPNDGVNPGAGLVQGSDGNFYGTTYYGGTSTNCLGGCGTVFRISPSGNYSNLYSFNFTDGFRPNGLVEGGDGNFYGTTWGGGTSTYCTDQGCGTVFRISPSGNCTSLYSFGASITGGENPGASLVEGRDGNFYGTTVQGGEGSTVFRISPTGSFSNLYTMNGAIDGCYPEGPLVQGSGGNLYGTTSACGSNFSSGNLFRISPDGSYANLHFFKSTVNGYGPYGGLVQGSDGNFYGTTEAGGTATDNDYEAWGTVFRFSPSGTFTSLYSFAGPPNDGGYPKAGLVQASDGNFYGTTANGTVFRIGPSGSYTNLYFFKFSDGTDPQAVLVQGSDGNFYGTTAQGVETNFNQLDGQGYGSVFKLTVPLNPLPNQISSAQVDSSGTNLVFNIPSVAYETYQLQFSPSMNPTNWSNISGAFVSNSIGALLTLTNFGGAVGPQGFYRFAITP